MEAVNPLLASSLDFLKQGDVERAEKEFTEAVSACCKAYGEVDIVTARTLAHLARVCSLRGKKDVAVQMYEKIIRIHEALPAPLNCDHAVALSELAVIREQGGSQGDADTLRRKADGIIDELGARVKASAETENDATESSDDEDDQDDSTTTSESGEDGDQKENNSSDEPAGISGRAHGISVAEEAV